MKIFALSCGRRNANCEILVKEALKAAETTGAEVEFARMLDLNIHTCNICWPCPVIMKNVDACIHKDDAAWLYNKLMDCDGFLLAAPCYGLTPPGMLLTIRDRILGPRVDVASLNEAKKTAGVDEKFESFGKMEIDERIFRRKVGAMISVGDATSKHWTSLNLATMQTVMMSAQYNIVDQMEINGIAEDGAITLHEDMLERARELGRNMVKGFEYPEDRKPFLGTEKAVCPVCHQGLMMMEPEDTKVHCAVCGIEGTCSIDEKGNMHVDFTEEAQKDSRLYYHGLLLHHYEVMQVAKELEPKLDLLPENRRAYQVYDRWMVKPDRQQ